MNKRAIAVTSFFALAIGGVAVAQPSYAGTCDDFTTATTIVNGRPVAVRTNCPTPAPTPPCKKYAPKKHWYSTSRACIQR